MAPAFDMKALMKLTGSAFGGNRKAAMIERLTLLYSGKFSVSHEESEFWRGKIGDNGGVEGGVFQQNPFLRCRAGAFWIRARKGGRIRLFPNPHQTIVLDDIEAAWEIETPFEGVYVKVRQDGISTVIATLILTCVLTYPDTTGHVTANLDPTAKHLLGMQKFMWDQMVAWDKPVYDPEIGGRKNDDEYAIEDPAMGVIGVRVRKDSAERRDKIALGFTLHWRNRSEMGAYEDAQAVNGTIRHAEVKTFPSFTIVDSQGYDRFGPLGELYFEIKDNPEPGRVARVFTWFTHPEYRKPLPPGLTPQKLWAGEHEIWRGIDYVKIHAKMDSLRNDDGKKLDAEQLYYYLTEYQVARRNGVLHVFHIHMPSTEDDCWHASNTGVFDNERVNNDKALAGNRALTSIDTLSKIQTATPLEIPKNWRPKYARCRLHMDEKNGFKEPKWIEDQFGGEFVVYEPHRKGHGYVVPVDLAEGKEQVKGVRGSDDESAVGVIRYSYDPRTDTPKKMLAVFCIGRMNPADTAKHALCLSIMYPNMGDSPAPIIFERNNQGKYFVESVKQIGKGREMWYWQSKTGEIVEEYQRIGIQMTGGGMEAEASKFRLVNNFKDDYSNDGIAIYDPTVLDQMSRFQRKANGTFKGVGSKDDAVSLMYLGIEACLYASPGRMLAAYPVEVDSSAERVVDKSDPYAGLTAEERDELKEKHFQEQLRGKRGNGGFSRDWWLGDAGQSGGDV